MDASDRSSSAADTGSAELIELSEEAYEQVGGGAVSVPRDANDGAL